MTSKLVNTPSGPIEYRLEGGGPTLMVLLGGHCSRDTRLSHERLVGHGFSILTPSRPGYDSTPSSTGRTAQAASDALAALLDKLDIERVDVIGVSAAGPTALAFAQRHPERVRKLVLESAVATDWDEGVKRRSGLGFGRLAPVTWGLLHLLLRIAPELILKLLLRDLTVLNPAAVLERLDPDDRAFILRMLQSSRASTGFLQDIEHRIDHLESVCCPTLVMYSPNDATVSPRNAERLARELPDCELYEVPSDTHLIWIGPSADTVWQRRLSFLKT